MSVEVLAIVISAATLLVTLSGMFIGAFAWMIRRIDGVHHDLGARIDGVQRELVEVKISIARIEGPPRHLVPAR